MAELPAGTQGQILVKGVTIWEAKDVDNVTVEVDATVGLKVKDGSIGNTQIVPTGITKSGTFSGASFTSLPLIPVSAGQIPSANLENATKGAAENHDTEVFPAASAPTSYTDLDLSAVISQKRALVFLKINNNDGAIQGDYSFRMNGDSFSVGGVPTTTLGAGTSAISIKYGEMGYVLVPTSALGVIQWKSSAAISTTITLRSVIILK